MEKAQQRMTESMEEFIDEIDRKYLRRIKKEMFDCSSRCLDDRSLKRTETESCIESCSSSIEMAQKYFNKELGTLGEQLNRCVMSGYDKTVQKYGEPKNNEEAKKIQKLMETQVTNCVNDHIALLPNIEKKFVNDLYNKLK
ncbi:Protein FAM136A [Strongyloides ratti]|uniref:Protein FAM136A n=1 Tax=Strongyloides ratti TaxID=34506 RepID=A0A090L6U0_STRRB|nr:Protein FAM136A [Strongyloides ratti]CEF63833.1 Protein FAM136A [Strongyloides ratti]